MKKDKLSRLHEAVFEGSLTAVQKAIEQGEEINTLDRDGRTPLFQAIIDGNLSIASELIKHGANVNAQDNDLETPLHFAAREHQLALAELLLRHGAHVDARDSHGNTPLFRAVFESKGRGELIKLLLANAADKRLENKHGVSPEKLANTIANYDVKRFLQ